MNNIIIKAENISKQYRLGIVNTGTFAHDINRWWYNIRGVEDPYLQIGEDADSLKNDKYIWALKDVSFTVQQGDVLGIIGRNGAGKSTLLKILSRTTSPTTGTIKIKGRIASLLEVGTGFHPELTGRENVFLNGAILGMTKERIKKKFDEITAFAGVEKYIDTPVKRYSSGMYVRLAFAVAAHLECEILIVDEVLAVGDVEFQKKCLGKMGEVSKQEGRTILFVSHNMAAIQNFCNKGLFFENGKLIFTASMHDTVSAYLKSINNSKGISLNNRTDRKGNGAVTFTSIELKNISGEKVNFLQSGGDFSLNLSLESKNKFIKELKIGVGINNQFGERIGHLNNEMTNQIFKNISCYNINIQINLLKLPLKHGRYSITLFSSVDDTIADWIEDAFFIDVEHGDFYKTGNILPDGQGDILIDHNFFLNPADV